MPRSFLIKKNNYSNCPLKKRPVTLYKEPQEEEGKDVADDNSEPENLSTKPEDLSLTASQHHYPHKAITPPPGVTLVSAKRTPLSERPDAVTSQPTTGVTSLHHMSHHGTVTSPHHPHYLGKTSGGPLEPLNLNTPAESHHHYATSPSSWHRGVTPHYPTPYLTFNYPYPPPAEMYHQYAPSIYPVSPARSSPLVEQQLSPYAPRDSSGSPPHHMFSSATLRASVSVVASLPHRQHQTAELPKLYMPYQSADHCGLSPTSSVGSSTSNTVFQSLSPLPATPEDLSSPGSVSSGSSSAGSTGGGKKRKEGSGAPRYQCPDCSKSYSTYSGLSKHQQFHCAATAGAQAKKSFTCKYCEKVYVSLGALKMHIRTHTLPCKCKLCGKAFSRPWLLQGHIRTHTGEKPFTCPHCNRAFADRSNLRAHLQTHSDVKKYSCSTCSKTFSRMSLLTKHMDGGCPGTTPAGPQFGLQRDSSSGDEAKIYQ
ncbi:protein escargot-like [Periplaneta americana]|uniref:protein escargot-like n=1 Tax=Periplaneta americana TaxID=6978 RepID=UPI0037E88863